MAFRVTLAVSLVALAVPQVMSLLIGDPAKIAAGQWWRLVTPVLVQPDGWGQLAFNLLGVAVVGTALERRIGWRSWTAVFLFGEICTILLTIRWHPSVTDGGSSAAVAALVAALTVLVALGHRQDLQLLDWTARIYCIIFVCYLTGMESETSYRSERHGSLIVAGCRKTGSRSCSAAFDVAVNRTA